MHYDHIIDRNRTLSDEHFHLACGYCCTTSFLFEKAGVAVVIDCKGSFTFYSADGEKTETFNAKPMDGGREHYEDVFITTTDAGIVFRLPDYSWTDHYPNCDGESDRWSCRIIGTRDEIRYPIQ